MTTDERLRALEEFRSTTAKHIRSTDENFTILLGVIRDQGIDIKHIFEQLESMQQENLIDRANMKNGFERMATSFEAIAKRLDRIQAKLDEGK